MFCSNNNFRDQLLTIQNRNTKKYSWPKKVFEHAINIIVVNCIAMKRMLSGQPISVLDFKMALMEQLRKVAMSNRVYSNGDAATLT